MSVEFRLNDMFRVGDKIILSGTFVPENNLTVGLCRAELWVGGQKREEVMVCGEVLQNSKATDLWTKDMVSIDREAILDGCVSLFLDL